MKEIGLRHLDTVSYLDGGTKKQPHTLIAYWMRERERERERMGLFFGYIYERLLFKMFYLKV